MSGGSHTQEANAALIASAPDMAAEIERLSKVNAELVAALTFIRGVLWEEARDDLATVADDALSAQEDK